MLCNRNYDKFFGNSKLQAQITNNDQSSILQILDLIFCIWNLFVICFLLIGIFPLFVELIINHVLRQLNIRFHIHFFEYTVSVGVKCVNAYC